MPPPAEPPRVAAVLLAAGASSRMGRNKMLEELDGEPLVRRAATRALAARLSPVVVVLGREAERVRHAVADLPCHFAVNPHFAGPTSTSLHLGLRRLPPEVDAVVVLLGDMIGVSEPMLRAVVAAASAGEAPVVASRYGGVIAPPLLFRRSLFAELLRCDGEGCGKRVVQRYQRSVLFLDWPAEALADVDTPADLARARTLPRCF
jgi:molybdenum cofactor cytidylyltransferase